MKFVTVFLFAALAVASALESESLQAKDAVAEPGFFSKLTRQLSFKLPFIQPIVIPAPIRTTPKPAAVTTRPTTRATPAPTTRPTTRATPAPTRPTTRAPAPAATSTSRPVEVSAPAQAPEVPAQAPEVPAQAPEVPAQAPEVPAQTPEVPAQAPEVPAQAPEVPAQAPEVPAQAPEVPAQAPQESAPAQGSPVAPESQEPSKKPPPPFVDFPLPIPEKIKKVIDDLYEIDFIRQRMPPKDFLLNLRLPEPLARFITMTADDIEEPYRTMFLALAEHVLNNNGNVGLTDPISFETEGDLPQ